MLREGWWCGSHSSSASLVHDPHTLTSYRSAPNHILTHSNSFPILTVTSCMTLTHSPAHPPPPLPRGLGGTHRLYVDPSDVNNGGLGATETESVKPSPFGWNSWMDADCTPWGAMGNTDTESEGPLTCLLGRSHGWESGSKCSVSVVQFCPQLVHLSKVGVSFFLGRRAAGSRSAWVSPSLWLVVVGG